MRHRIFFAAAVLSLLLAAAPARAQSPVDEHKFEAGAFFTAINLEGFGETVPGAGNRDAVVKGLGGRAGYNFTENFALDAEASFFPETALGNEQFGQKTQAFVGIKAGARNKRAGVFAKARPGVMFIGEVTSGFDCDRGTSVTVCRPEHNAFAFDAGGVVEFYPSSRAILRVDAGDTIIRLRRGVAPSGGLIFANPAQPSTNTTHNFQVSVGFGYRF